MRSEALRKIKTLREARLGIDLARQTRARTTNSLSKTAEELKNLAAAEDRRLPRILAAEVKRFNAADAAVQKSRGRVLRARQRLAEAVNRNRAIMELRHRLQEERWKANSPAPAAPPPPPGRLRQADIEY